MRMLPTIRPRLSEETQSHSQLPKAWGHSPILWKSTLLIRRMAWSMFKPRVIMSISRRLPVICELGEYLLVLRTTWHCRPSADRCSLAMLTRKPIFKAEISISLLQVAVLAATVITWISTARVRAKNTIFRELSIRFPKPDVFMRQQMLTSTFNRSMLLQIF